MCFQKYSWSVRFLQRLPYLCKQVHLSLVCVIFVWRIILVLLKKLLKVWRRNRLFPSILFLLPLGYKRLCWLIQIFLPVAHKCGSIAQCRNNASCPSEPILGITRIKLVDICYKELRTLVITSESPMGLFLNLKMFRNFTLHQTP